MRKFGFSVLCCVAAAAFLGGCNKNEDKCCGSSECKDKAAVKMDAGATPASDASCASKCSGQKAAGSCCKSKQAQ